MDIAGLKVSLGRGYLQDDEFVVDHIALSEKSHGKWCVYNLHGVERTNRWCFDSESEACENLLKRAKRISGLREKYGKMTKNDLKIELDLAGVNPGAYDLQNIRYADSRVVLKHEAANNWSVYSDDRGKRLDLIKFDSESEACEHLLDRVLSLIERFGAYQWG